MSREKLPFRLLLLLGVVAAVVLHSAGALHHADALRVAELRDDVFGGRVLALGADLVDLLDVRYGPFQSLHLAAALFLALAAALSGAAAFREGDRAAGAGLAAALLLGGAVLFGADLGGAGRSAGPLAVTVCLLAAATACWVREQPLALTGGLFLGLAVAAHPFTLFLLPGLLLVARRDASTGRVLLGVALGSLALHLPPPDGSVGGGLAAWWQHGGWTLSAPTDWGANTADLGRGLYGNLGVIGILLALVGLVAARGDARFRPWIVAALLPAAALVAGRSADSATAGALTAWAVLFWAPPALIAAARRLPGFALPGVAVVGGAALLAANYGVLRDNGEPGSDWALDAFRTLPDGSLFLTDNPVHFALADHAPHAEVEWTGRTSPEDVRVKLSDASQRPTFVDAALFFNAARRNAVLGQEYRAHANGVTFRIVPRSAGVPELNPDVWSDSRPDFPSRKSPLRDGLTIAEYYGRSLLQSGYLRAQDRAFDAAERDFLFALSLGKPNPSLAALGLARVEIQSGNRSQALITLSENLRTEDEGAWTGFELLGDLYRQKLRAAEAKDAFERALRLCPSRLAPDRERITGKLETVRS